MATTADLSRNKRTRESYRIFTRAADGNKERAGRWFVVRNRGIYGDEARTMNEGRIALLTGGGDKPYALGLATALTSAGTSLDFVGSNDLRTPELLNNPLVSFLNLRRDQNPNANVARKVMRVLSYYCRLIWYAANARPRLFHILWNNKFDLIDRVFLMLYYRALRKKVAFTAHNVNAAKRDSNDSFLNRLSLRIQYRLCDHIFVHTAEMKSELISDFGLAPAKISVIPFGINNTVPNTRLCSEEAKRQLGLAESDRAILFFGNIAPYKGLEYLIAAFGKLATEERDLRLIIAGRPKGPPDYWQQIQKTIEDQGIHGRIIQRIQYIPDDQIELYFKAADVLILPYTHIFQSGVLLLGYAFGLPAIASDVGPLKEDVLEARTGFICQPRDPSDLAKAICRYFDSELFRNLETRRAEIKQYANERYSWGKVAEVTKEVYLDLNTRG